MGPVLHNAAIYALCILTWYCELYPIYIYICTQNIGLLQKTGSGTTKPKTLYILCTVPLYKVSKICMFNKYFREMVLFGEPFLLKGLSASYNPILLEGFPDIKPIKGSPDQETLSDQL